MFSVEAFIRRGFQHLTQIAGSAVIPDQREQLLALIRILLHSRTPLRESGLPGLMHFLDEQASAHDFAEDIALGQADTVAALVPIRPFRHCLRRAILRYVILKSRGQSPAFVIGVARPDRRALNGHAWVTLNGIAYQEDDDQHQRMTPIFCYPAS